MLTNSFRFDAAGVVYKFSELRRVLNRFRALSAVISICASEYFASFFIRLSPTINTST